MALSAAQSLDLLDRIYSFDGVAPPEPEPETMLWVGTSLAIAGVPLLVGEGELEEIIETPAVTSIPGTKPWVMGIAAHKGGLLPIISGDVLFRKRPYAGRIRDYSMVVRRSGFYFGITLSDIERTVKFPAELRDMVHPIDADLAPFTLGGFKQNDRFLGILDLDKLIADSEIFKASASATESDLTEEQSNG